MECGHVSGVVSEGLERRPPLLLLLRYVMTGGGAQVKRMRCEASVNHHISVCIKYF